MRKILPVLLALVIVVGCASEPKEFKSEAGNFSVMTPVTMEETTNNEITALGTIVNHKFGGENRSAAYVVMYFDFPPSVPIESKVEEVLAGCRDAEIAGLKGTRTSEKSIKVDGAPGNEFTFTGVISGTNFDAKARMFVVGKRFFYIVALNKENKATAEQVDNFLNSFKLLKK